MKLSHVLRALDIPQFEEVFLPHWDESSISLPHMGANFPDADAIIESCSFAGLPSELNPLLIETVQKIRSDPSLRLLAWHCHRLLFVYNDYPASEISRWPELDARLGELSGVFYLIVALGFIPITRAHHKALSIPEEITRDTCNSPFEELTRFYREAHGGRWGAVLQVLYWLRHYTAGELFRLGRFEYMVRPFQGQVQAFRHRSTREVVALAEDGVWFDRFGHTRSGDNQDEKEGWTSRLVENEDAFIGYPISPAGFAIHREIRLSRSQWNRVLAKGAPMLEVHIPFGGGMTLERCATSMQQALNFFPRYFPDRPFAGFTCSSWILNPDIADFYRPTSNMVLWQKELYLFPWPSDGKAGLFFIFGTDEINPKTAPRNTSIRRAMLDHLASGGLLRNGGMFMLTEDFRHFGTQYYRSHFPPQALERWQDE